MSNAQNNKVAIVTGSSRGIGHAIAVKLAADGFAVTVNYVSKAAEADAVVAEIIQAGGRAFALQADVSKATDAEKLFAETEKKFGGVDVIVNNAGVMAIKPLADIDDDAFDRMMNINVKGSFNMMRLATKRLRDEGRIINFSTSAIVLSLPGYAVYNATKGAVEAMTKVMAKELGARRITVNAVAPGPVATELFFEGKSDEFVERLIKMIPMQRLAQVEDIAPVVAFLASPAARWISGQTLRANGGVG